MIRRPLLFAAVAVLLADAPLAELWYESYQQGEEALAARDWNEAVRQFNSSITLRPDPGVGVRTYGMNFINYHPYLKMGIAYYNLGKLEEALQAFETEERFGEIAKSPREQRNLQAFRKLAQEEIQKSQLGERERIAGIVAKSLDDARALEQVGRLDDAMAALASGLAVDQNNPDLRGTMERLQGLAAAEKRARDAKARARQSVQEGTTLLASGKYQEASRAFNQALSLDPEDAEAKRLLADSQERLRAEIEAKQGADARLALVRDGLAAAAGLERAGQVEVALERLQSVLALEPENREAIAMQVRLLRSQADADSQKAQEEEVAQSLAEADALIGKGQYAQSVVLLNRVIGLDPGNTIARESRSKAIELLEVAGPARSERFTPDIKLFNDTNAVDDQQRSEERVSSPDFALTGYILSNYDQIEVSFQDEVGGPGPTGQQAPLKAVLQTGELVVAGMYHHQFSQPFRLSPGAMRLKVVAMDPGGLTGEESHQVRYIRPLTRSPLFYSTLGGLAVATAAGLAARRARKRKFSRKRRFNPYIAGAPVLNEDLFLGREALLTRILQTIHNNSILLYGERRIGKTSLQHHLKRRLQKVEDPEYQFYPVYVDLQGTPQERFFSTLAQDIFEELSPILDGARPGRGLPDGAPYAYETFVRDVHAVLKALRQRGPRKVKLVLLIDEVDELNNYDPRVNQKLRSLFMKSFAEDLVAVVSGVGIKKHWESEGSPWYNFFEEIEVKPFTRADAEDLIERPIRGIFKLERSAMDRIIASTGCRPYLIQKVCVALVNRMHNEGRRRITVADVEAVGTPTEG